VSATSPHVNTDVVARRLVVQYRLQCVVNPAILHSHVLMPLVSYSCEWLKTTATCAGPEALSGRLPCSSG
jgi:hypothetical protein